MSIQFSDITTLKGLVQIYEKEIGADRGFVSDNSNRLKEFCADVNLAWDDYLNLAFKSSGMWQFDDTNHVDGSGNYTLPIIRTNLIDGQREYNFTTDEGGALVLDIQKVAILPSATATLYEEIYPIDQQSRDQAKDIVAESTVEGVPCQYDKTANSIFLDPIPSYTTTGGSGGSYGLKVYINREASYFTSSDTTKKPGCPGIHHRYFALKPALDYARRNDKSNYDRILKEVISFEGDEENGVTGSIERYFARRARDEKPRVTPKLSSYV